tara:strand:+ start:1344 stop:1739 length:396 start_codon:yes stop_codon:yes gene_type:complete
MPEVEVSGVSDLKGGFEPLPVGQYPVTVTQCDIETAKSGSLKLSWRFQVDNPEFAGRVLFHNTSLQPQAAWRLIQELDALGVRYVPEGEKPNIVVKFNSDDCVGRRATADVIHEDWEGKIRNKIGSLLPCV